jgi:uncharacterized membrane protein YgcG
VEKAVSEIIGATDELRPGKEPPPSARMRSVLARVFEYYVVFFLLGALAVVFLKLGKKRFKLKTGTTILIALLLFAALPALSQLFLHGAWYWTPIVYLTGALAAAGFVAGIGTQETKALKWIAALFTALPALASLVLICYLLQIVKPAQGAMGRNEQSLIVFLCFTNLIQLILLIVLSGIASGSGGSYGSGGSSSSRSSGSSSSGSSSFSGGGGGFGGGGASSSW